MRTLLSGGGMMTDGNGAEYDTRVARAIDRVLEGESLAQASIAECEQQSRDSLEHARHAARAILDRAHERIVALHTKAAQGLEERAAKELDRSQAAGSAVAPPVDAARPKAAIQRLADILLGRIEQEP